MKYKIDVCLSPALLPNFDFEDSIVVVVDILRATTCMVTGLAHGIEKIIPVLDLDTCKAYKTKGFVIAAERDGKIVEGFDIGNSPYSYMKEAYKGKSVATSTTNGTKAIEAVKGASQVLIGAFGNLEALQKYLITQEKNVLVLCAGWKDHVNVEDTLFAGAIALALEKTHLLEHDATLLAKELYKVHKDNMFAFISQCSHVRRLKSLGIEKDILFALTPNNYKVIPVLKDNTLVALSADIINI